MDRQRRHQLLFGLFVRGLGAGRFARASTPLLASVALCVAGFTANHLPVGETAFDARLGETDVQDVGRASPFPASNERTVVGLPLAMVSVGPSSSIPVLSREQQNIARFITKTYQVASEQTQWFVEHAYRAARELKMDPMLILAIISVESSFDPRAQSQRGAQGLMQVLTRVHADKFSAFGGVAAAFDPLANIRVGAEILHGYLKRDGSVEGALKAYVGASSLPHDGGYGAKVIFERDRIAAAAAGRSVPVAPMSAVPHSAAALPEAASGLKLGEEASSGATRPDGRMVTDSPLLLPPAAFPAEVSSPESAAPAQAVSPTSTGA